MWILHSGCWKDLVDFFWASLFLFYSSDHRKWGGTLSSAVWFLNFFNIKSNTKNNHQNELRDISYESSFNRDSIRVKKPV